MSATYAKLTERNDHEGETWHFYIPIEGNQDALAQLETALAPFAEKEPEELELDLTPIPELEVDVLVKHGGDTDYMAAHNKLEGRLVLSPEILASLSTGDVGPLYKGGISDCMKATTP